MSVTRVLASHVLDCLRGGVASRAVEPGGNGGDVDMADAHATVEKGSEGIAQGDGDNSMGKGLYEPMKQAQSLFQMGPNSAGVTASVGNGNGGSSGNAKGKGKFISVADPAGIAPSAVAKNLPMASTSLAQPASGNAVAGAAQQIRSLDFLLQGLDSATRNLGVPVVVAAVAAQAVLATLAVVEVGGWGKGVGAAPTEVTKAIGPLQEDLGPFWEAARKLRVHQGEHGGGGTSMDAGRPV